MTVQDRIAQFGEDRIPARFESQKDRLVYLLAEYKLGVYIAALAAIGFIATGRLQVSVPEPVRLLLIGIAIGIIPATAVGFRLIDRWLPDPRIKVLVFDPDGPEIEPKRIPRQLWQSRVVEDMPVWSISRGETDAIVTDIDHVEATDTLRVRGVNPELADPVSMVARDERLSKVYGDLIETVRELKAQEMTEASRQVEIERQAIDEIIAAVEDGALLSDGEFTDSIRDGPPDPRDETRHDTVEQARKDLIPDMPDKAENYDHDQQQRT